MTEEKIAAVIAAYRSEKKTGASNDNQDFRSLAQWASEVCFTEHCSLITAVTLQA